MKVIDVNAELKRLALELAPFKSQVPQMMDLVRETFAERAAVREFLGGIHREVAERYAVRDTFDTFGIKFD